MNCVLKTRNCVLETTNCGIEKDEFCRRATELELENAQRKQGHDLLLRYFYDGDVEENGGQSGALTVGAAVRKNDEFRINEEFCI